MARSQLIVLCDCSKAALREKGRLSAMDLLCREIINTVVDKKTEYNVKIIGYDTKSSDDDTPVFVEKDLETEYNEGVLPSNYHLFKGNSPLGKAILRASELIELCGEKNNVVIIIVSCIGNGDVPSDYAFKVSCQNNILFQNALKVIIGVNTKDQTVDELSYIASTDGFGKLHAYKSSDFIDFVKIIG